MRLKTKYRIYYSFLGILLFLIVLAFIFYNFVVTGYNPAGQANASIFGHSANEIDIRDSSIPGEKITLQDWYDKSKKECKLITKTNEGLSSNPDSTIPTVESGFNITWGSNSANDSYGGSLKIPNECFNKWCFFLILSNSRISPARITKIIPYFHNTSYYVYYDKESNSSYGRNDSTIYQNITNYVTDYSPLFFLDYGITSFVNGDRASINNEIIIEQFAQYDHVIMGYNYWFLIRDDCFNASRCGSVDDNGEYIHLFFPKNNIHNELYVCEYFPSYPQIFQFVKSYP